MQDTKIPSFVKYLNPLVQDNRIIVWLALYVILFLVSCVHLEWHDAVWSSLFTLILIIFLCTLLQYVLLPHFFHKNRFLLLLTSVVVVILLTHLKVSFDIWYNARPNDAAPNQKINNPQFFNYAKYGMLFTVTAFIMAFFYMMQERTVLLENFEKQQMQDQIKYLRAQMNPHFLFNALNCIYALAIDNDEKTADSVLKLSEMLRYVVDDCRADEVSLDREIAYIQNYIDFQRIRMEREPDLTLDVFVANRDYKIPPMILQPIIENCFKHSRLVDDPKAWIHISLRQNASGFLFTCDNSKPAANSFTRRSHVLGRSDEERTGIGLVNVRERLRVLFGDKCSLKIIEDETHYKTIMHI